MFASTLSSTGEEDLPEKEIVGQARQVVPVMS